MSKAGKPERLPRWAYRGYIQSEAWREKRRAYFASKLPKDCWICGVGYRPGFHLHHRTYKRLGFERISVDLVPACPSCHDQIHKIEKDQDVSVWRATKIARSARARFERRQRRKAKKQAQAAQRQRAKAAKARIPSPDEILAARSPHGGWSRKTLAGWGIFWPPPKGWKGTLESKWLSHNANFV